MSALYEDLAAWHIRETLFALIRRQHAHFDLSAAESVQEGHFDEPPMVPFVAVGFDFENLPDVVLGVQEPTFTFHVTAWCGGESGQDAKWNAVALLSDIQLALLADRSLGDLVHDVIFEGYDAINGDEHGMTPGYGIAAAAFRIPYRSDDGSL